MYISAQTMVNITKTIDKKEEQKGDRKDQIIKFMKRKKNKLDKMKRLFAQSA